MALLLQVVSLKLIKMLKVNLVVYLVKCGVSGLASTFGGAQQQIGGVQKTTDFLDKSTWVLAIILGLLILMSNVSLINDSNDGESILIDESISEETIPEIPEIPESTAEEN